MSIIIERAIPADAAAIIEYLKQVGKETDNLTFGEEGVPITAEAEAAYLAQIEDSADDIMLLAKENGIIVGIAGLNRQPRRMSHRGELSVTVLKDYWNRGIGGQLIEQIIQFAQDNAFEIVDLQVRSDNVSAIHLYEKYGFKKLFTYPGFFKIKGQEIDFDFMCLRLS